MTDAIPLVPEPRRRTVARIRFSLLVGMLAGCATPTAPLLPNGAVSLDPPVIYRTWWAAMERCSGRHADFDRVQWFVVEGSSFNDQEVGRWFRDGHRIVIASWHVETALVVQHEVLHDLLSSAGHGPAFERCSVALE